MEKHNGQITEYLVRKNGFSITELAIALNVNRRSIYNYFQNKHLKYDVMLKIGRIIRHDFSQEFPEYFTSEEFEVSNKQYSNNVMDSHIQSTEDGIWKDKYIDLLEKHQQLLLSRIAKNDNFCLK
ncbi:TetR/AcrR family transcriptional regulator [Mucilaginibacter pallidiroseus]|uniref:TetR/AcrR family transcriptional regulator n=1 Tax=Mucilaginibacter pallidiroseus TaxID=2599295 RepID=A0A563U0T2_9SPHI|nr:TetR/AcrR family transcriptional regulator [Mucilaginibacter pallidiroseus]TWR25255.1 TetR/AcrR family transcriptional regulator [Mucilaginibacter pallidiroseus]